MDKNAPDRIWPYAAVTSRSGFRSPREARTAGCIHVFGLLDPDVPPLCRAFDFVRDQFLLPPLRPVGLGNERNRCARFRASARK